eukprot:CAMPEP_0185276428 /NCGR_PEP_ID=MMETSP1359-20130426/56143_1 /TAXON_ID=552665 /ORGANISM="Bigelowiella longifila, Strain CCMP242" /LENGTH=81 /DNA_ID=CAMNT_0027870089 /DNA_START=606 /DNA_END=851 /DNA_ORIENTATION=-
MTTACVYPHLKLRLYSLAFWDGVRGLVLEGRSREAFVHDPKNVVQHEAKVIRVRPLPPQLSAAFGHVVASASKLRVVAFFE